MKISIDKQVALLLKRMEKAMPEVRRQVEVYERNLKNEKVIKSLTLLK
jgi:hypothetical protein